MNTSPTPRWPDKGRPHIDRARLVGAFFAGALLVSACGGSSTADVAAPPDASAPASTSVEAADPAPTTAAPRTVPATSVAESAPDVAPISTLPSVMLTNATTGASVDLAGFGTTALPKLFWFWAPH